MSNIVWNNIRPALLTNYAKLWLPIVFLYYFITLYFVYIVFWRIKRWLLKYLIFFFYIHKIHFFCIQISKARNATDRIGAIILFYLLQFWIFCNDIRKKSLLIRMSVCIWHIQDKDWLCLILLWFELFFFRARKWPIH